MEPKKPSEIVKKTAEKLGISELLVDDVVSIYWSELKKMLVNLDHHRIYVPRLGTFVAKEWKIAEKIDREYLYKNRYRYRQFIYMQDLDEKQQFIKLKLLYQKEKKDREKHMQKRKLDEEGTGNMESQG